MRAQITILIEHVLEDCDDATRRQVELSMAGFREALEAVIAEHLAAECPHVQLTFDDGETAL